ncbi:MAG: methyltransferase domain-containing protein [Pseudomonadota bacterium]
MRSLKWGRTMAKDERYFAGAGDDDRERARLRLLEECLDPISRTALLAAGLKHGSQVLEVGPGAGSMVRWMSGAVSHAGRITAFDINPRFVTGMKLPNVTVQVGDIVYPPHGLGPFDIIYARYVMMHLPDPVAVARSILGLLRPGGTAVIIDPDMRTLRAADPTHPRAAEFDATTAAGADVLRDAGIMDIDFGPKGPVAFETAGFEKVVSEGTNWMAYGGSTDARFLRDSLPQVDAAIRAFAPNRVLDPSPVIAAYNDPTFGFFSPVQVVTTGRRPLD